MDKHGRGSNASVKKARTASSNTGKGRGRVAKLQYFQEIPLDLLLEIARMLDPQTLLNMTRVNRRLNRIFASRSAAPIWQAVRSNVGLPELESKAINDLEYASLLYDRECHLCGAGRAVLVDYILLIRWCKSCQTENLMDVRNIRAKLPDLHEDTLAASVRTRHPSADPRIWDPPYYCLTDVEGTDDRLWDLEEAEDFERLDKYVAKHKKIAAARLRDGDALRRWANRVEAQKKQDKVDKGKQREAQIIQRLLDLGYDRRDCELWTLGPDLIRKPTRLTEASWRQMKDEVIECVERNRERRLLEEEAERQYAAQDALEPYYKRLKAAAGEPDTFPLFDTFVKFPSVQPLWRPKDAMLSAEIWLGVVPNVKQDLAIALRRLRVTYARRVLQMLRDDKLDYDDDAARRLGTSTSTFASTIDETSSEVTETDLDQLLNRFRNLFWCRCGTVLPFPAIHAHRRERVRNCFESSNKPVPQSIRRQLDALRQAANLPDHVDAFGSLHALGPVFCCHGCSDLPELPGRAPYWLPSPAKPAAAPHLTLDELIKHTLDYHHREPGLYSREPTTGVTEMRLATVTYADADQ
ncbi:hypothetical protein JCM10908_003023 [Rhodotorula pacifica]|uniref:F-box protein n=1 Tax=Rhodotorula pacifica TaxID=1495444 RepID=UPI00316DB6EB